MTEVAKEDPRAIRRNLVIPQLPDAMPVRYQKLALINPFQDLTNSIWMTYAPPLSPANSYGTDQKITLDRQAMDSLRRLVLTPVLVGVHAAYLLTEQIASAATSSTSARLSTPSRHSLRSPKHVAFSIVTSHGRHSASSRDSGANSGDSRSRREPQRSRKGKEKAREGQWTEQEACVLETVREAVAWALRNEVDEISLWNEDGELVLLISFEHQHTNRNLFLSIGILEDVLPGLLSILVPSPPTPPASGSCSPPRFSSLSRRHENGESKR
jgi:hypothetical protein